MDLEQTIREKIAKEIASNKTEKAFVINCLEAGVNKNELKHLFLNTKTYKNLLKNNEIFTNEIINNFSGKNYLKHFEDLNDKIEKLIITNKAKKLMNSLFSKKYKGLINNESEDLFITLINSGMTRNELEEGTFKKLSIFESAEQLNNHLVEKYLNTFEYKDIIKQIKESGAELLESGSIVSAKISNHEQMEKLGTEMWCVQRSDRVYDEYTEGADYFIINFNLAKRKHDPRAHTAAIVDTKGEVVEIYDSKDNLIEDSYITNAIEENTEVTPFKDLSWYALERNLDIEKIAIKQNRIEECEKYYDTEIDRDFIKEEIKSMIFDGEASNKQKLLNILTPEELDRMICEENATFTMYESDPDISKTLHHIISNDDLKPSLISFLDKLNEKDREYRMGELLSCAVFAEINYGTDTMSKMNPIAKSYFDEDKCAQLLISEYFNADLNYTEDSPFRKYILDNHSEKFITQVIELDTTLPQFLINEKDALKYIKKQDLNEEVKMETMEMVTSMITTDRYLKDEKLMSEFNKGLKILDHFGVKKIKTSGKEYLMFLTNATLNQNSPAIGKYFNVLESNERNLEINNWGKIIFDNSLKELKNKRSGYENITVSDTNYYVDKIFESGNQPLINALVDHIKSDYEYSKNSRFQIDERHDFLSRMNERIETKLNDKKIKNKESKKNAL